MARLSPKGWRPRPCTRCGQEERVYRPAWLRAVRERAGVTLREFCRRLGKNPSFISNVETGKVHCPVWLSEEYEKLFEATARA